MHELEIEYESRSFFVQFVEVLDYGPAPLEDPFLTAEIRNVFEIMRFPNGVEEDVEISLEELPPAVAEYIQDVCDDHCDFLDHEEDYYEDF